MINSDISLEHPIAYFCAEYGLEAGLPIYAGGLGILAGDTLKAAVDANLPFTAIGLLYRGEDAKQSITEDGDQIEEDFHFDPHSVGLEPVHIDDQPLYIKVHMTKVDVWMKCWKKQLSNNVVLYLLDTETEQNHLEERTITHALYHGTEDSQFKQMLLLGIGGVKLLHALNIHPSHYHVNEGRPAFLHWQQIRANMDMHGMAYPEAKKAAIEKTVYTNHTLVGAGNPGYPTGLVKIYGQYYADKMGVQIEELLKDGIENDDQETFRVTRFALNVSRKASGVSQIHYALSEKQWPEYKWVGITNGIHKGTWQAENIHQMQEQGFQDDHALWQAHQQNKKNLAEFVQQQTGFGYDPNRMVISWARRIAGYKQLGSIFEDVERLRDILSNKERPVQLLISGKAHFGDTHGKALLKQIITYLQQQLAGYALYIPNYNIDIAKQLVQGSDVWLNTPEKDKEASGTSGMKAISNGVLQMSVNDGWVPEVDWQAKGWILDHTNLSESIYQTLEHQAVPLYFDRNSTGLPETWLKMMRASIEESNTFSAARMLQEYQDLLYS
jgi:alpha-glucan phosphorylase-like protein